MKNTTSFALTALLLAVATGCGGADEGGLDGARSTDALVGEGQDGDGSSSPPDQGAAPAPDGADDGPTPACAPQVSAPGLGMANPAATYCVELGYMYTESACVFPDGEQCDGWAFFRGECGQARSFCSRQGGTLTNVTEDLGGWTASYAQCTLPSGASCRESEFFRTCVCE